MYVIKKHYIHGLPCIRISKSLFCSYEHVSSQDVHSTKYLKRSRLQRIWNRTYIWWSKVLEHLQLMIT